MNNIGDTLKEMKSKDKLKLLKEEGLTSDLN
jgi:hypothetical protein